MDAANRSVIAYIVGSLITGAPCWVMHDHDRNRKFCLEGLFTNCEVKVYSHELNAHISGRGADGQYALRWTGSGGSVNLSINTEERTFRGWDHQTSRHFFGQVIDLTVHIYDFQDLQWHLYTL
jgi:hypothetical protein